MVKEGEEEEIKIYSEEVATSQVGVEKNQQRRNKS
jgi:hypothetical protein